MKKQSDCFRTVSFCQQADLTTIQMWLSYLLSIIDVKDWIELENYNTVKVKGTLPVPMPMAPG